MITWYVVLFVIVGDGHGGLYLLCFLSPGARLLLVVVPVAIVVFVLPQEVDLLVGIEVAQVGLLQQDSTVGSRLGNTKVLQQLLPIILIVHLLV